MIPEAINGFLNSSRKISLTNSKINKDPYSFIFDYILFCKRDVFPYSKTLSLALLSNS